MQNIAFCGLDCTECPAWKATRDNDDALRSITAEKWTKDYGFPFQKDMINCTGCHEPGAKIGHCSQCEMRLCGEPKGLEHCGRCAEYRTCGKIEAFIKLVPAVRTNLES